MDRLTITIELHQGQLVARCPALSCEVRIDPDENGDYSSVLDPLGSVIDLAIVAYRHDGDRRGTSALARALVSDEDQEQIDYEAFRDKLTAAFVRAYPKAESHHNVMLLIPFFDWDDPTGEWGRKERAAYDALINEGPKAKAWIDWVQEITSSKLPGFAEFQQRDVYQRWVDLGLPVRSFEETINPPWLEKQKPQEQRSQQQAKLRELIAAGRISEVQDLLSEMEPIDVVLFRLSHPEVGDLDYWIACVNEWLMFETSYLWTVTGPGPYKEAAELGLNEADIAKYQQQWREVGVEPTVIQCVDGRFVFPSCELYYNSTQEFGIWQLPPSQREDQSWVVTSLGGESFTLERWQNLMLDVDPDDLMDNYILFPTEATRCYPEMKLWIDGKECWLWWRYESEAERSRLTPVMEVQAVTATVEVMEDFFGNRTKYKDASASSQGINLLTEVSKQSQNIITEVFTRINQQRFKYRHESETPEEILQELAFYNLAELKPKPRDKQNRQIIVLTEKGRQFAEELLKLERSPASTLPSARS